MQTDHSLAISQTLDVLRIIARHSSESPIKAEVIESLTGVDARNVAALVSEYTKRGYRVCSGSHGYFWGTHEEFQEQIDKERRRAIEILRKVNSGRRNEVSEITLFEQDVA